MIALTRLYEILNTTEASDAVERIRAAAATHRSLLISPASELPQGNDKIAVVHVDDEEFRRIFGVSSGICFSPSGEMAPTVVVYTDEKEEEEQVNMFTVQAVNMQGEVVEDYFRVCPACKKSDGYINVGKGHWFYCKEHKIRWFVGANLFSSWKYQTEAEQREIYDRLGFGEFH